MGATAQRELGPPPIRGMAGFGDPALQFRLSYPRYPRENALVRFFAFRWKIFSREGCKGSEGAARLILRQLRLPRETSHSMVLSCTTNPIGTAV